MMEMENRIGGSKEVDHVGVWRRARSRSSFQARSTVAGGGPILSSRTPWFCRMRLPPWPPLQPRADVGAGCGPISGRAAPRSCLRLTTPTLGQTGGQGVGQSVGRLDPVEVAFDLRPTKIRLSLLQHDLGFVGDPGK
ncbi:unnamed protein product [Calypogeia fissa]